MRFLAYIFFLVTTYAHVIPHKRHSSRDKFLKLSFKKTHKGNTTDKILFKRGTSEFELINQSTFYSVDLDIGTPIQSVTVLLDTGSSDLWITGYDNPYCSSNGGTTSSIDCSIYGTFNKRLSSTFHDNETSFSITYADETFAKGTWGQDVLSIGGVDISGVSFAVADNTDSQVGVLGIGFEALETTAGATGNFDDPYTYPNLPVVLKNNGVIETVAYCLYLDSADASEGSILFGGVDKNKYSDDLYTIPIINIYENYPKPISITVTLQGLGISSSVNDETITASQIPVLLDSGTTLTYFPSSYVALIAEALGATYVSSGFYELDCPSADDDREFVFDFGGFHITAPLSSFIIKPDSPQDICLLGVVAQSGSSGILGDLFLTHAYVVYDLENYEVSIAQASYNTDEEDIKAIGSTVPNAVKASGYTNTWSGGSSYVSGGNIFTLSDTIKASSTTAAPSSTTKVPSVNTVSTLLGTPEQSSETFSTTTDCTTGDILGDLLCFFSRFS